MVVASEKSEIDEMDNKEEVLAALEDFARKPSEKVPPILDEYLVHVASTGETIFPWTKVRPLFLSKLEQVMQDFFKDVPTDTLPPCPNVKDVKFTEMKENIVTSIKSFNGPPFTIQRLCELVTKPRVHYKRTDKFLRGIEKNLLVVSTVDPFGNKIVSESKNLMNGMDSNGCDGDKESSSSVMHSPFILPPAPPSSAMNSPNSPPRPSRTDSPSPIGGGGDSFSPFTSWPSTPVNPPDDCRSPVRTPTLDRLCGGESVAKRLRLSDEEMDSTESPTKNKPLSDASSHVEGMNGEKEASPANLAPIEVRLSPSIVPEASPLTSSPSNSGDLDASPAREASASLSSAPETSPAACEANPASLPTPEISSPTAPVASSSPAPEVKSSPAPEASSSPTRETSSSPTLEASSSPPCDASSSPPPCDASSSPPCDASSSPPCDASSSPPPKASSSPSASPEAASSSPVAATESTSSEAASKEPQDISGSTDVGKDEEEPMDTGIAEESGTVVDEASSSASCIPLQQTESMGEVQPPKQTDVSSTEGNTSVTQPKERCEEGGTNAEVSSSEQKDTRPMDEEPGSEATPSSETCQSTAAASSDSQISTDTSSQSSNSTDSNESSPTQSDEPSKMSHSNTMDQATDDTATSSNQAEQSEDGVCQSDELASDTRDQPSGGSSTPSQTSDQSDTNNQPESSTPSAAGGAPTQCEQSSLEADTPSSSSSTSEQTESAMDTE